MKKLRPIIPLLISLFVYSASSAQTGKTIERLESAEQNCLDSGTNMIGCAQTFYFQMDSLLNVVYTQLRSSLDSSQKSALKKDQKVWLAKRSLFFKKTLNTFKKKNPDKSPYGLAIGAQDDAMIMCDDNAEFVKNRVLILLGRL